MIPRQRQEMTGAQTDALVALLAFVGHQPVECEAHRCTRCELTYTEVEAIVEMYQGPLGPDWVGIRAAVDDRYLAVVDILAPRPAATAA